MQAIAKQLQVHKAVQAEVLRVQGIAIGHTTSQSLLEARKMSRLTTEKQLRQNIQEDTRKVLGLFQFFSSFCIIVEFKLCELALRMDWKNKPIISDNSIMC